MSENHAILCITSSCPHCPSLMEGLGQQVKQGKLARLEIINIEQTADFAREHGIRSVPWFQIGQLIFEGLHTPSEIAYWCENADNSSGISRYLSERLAEGKLAQVSSLVDQHPEWLGLLLTLSGDSETPMQVKIGTGALFEERTGSPELRKLVPLLKSLLQNDQASTRADACHYLSLIDDPGLIPVFEHCLEDADTEVQEIAREALQSRQT